MRAVVEDVCTPVRTQRNRGDGTLTIREGPRNDAISPRSWEEEMGQLCERIRQCREEEGRHHQSQPGKV